MFKWLLRFFALAIMVYFALHNVQTSEIETHFIIFFIFVVILLIIIDMGLRATIAKEESFFFTVLVVVVDIIAIIMPCLLCYKSTLSPPTAN